jgi:hypothetical protein
MKDDNNDDDAADEQGLEGKEGAARNGPDERVRDLAVARDIMAGEFERGTVATIRGLTLYRENVSGNHWSVQDEDEQLVDVVAANRFRSAKQFLEYIDDSLSEDNTRWAL